MFVGVWLMIKSMSWPLIVISHLAFFACWDYQKPFLFVLIFSPGKKKVCVHHEIGVSPSGLTYCNSFYANFSNWAESGLLQIKPLEDLIPSKLEPRFFLVKIRFGLDCTDGFYSKGFLCFHRGDHHQSHFHFYYITITKNSISMRSTEQANNVCSLPKSPPIIYFYCVPCLGQTVKSIKLAECFGSTMSTYFSLFQCLIMCDEIGSLISLWRLGLSAVSAPDFSL